MAECQTRALIDRLVLEVADHKDVDPTELDPPLNEVIDVEALASLFSPRNGGIPRDGDGYVEFPYEEYRIRVGSDGSIDIDEVGAGE